MPNHLITLKRQGINGFLSCQSIGTDALDALSSIPGVVNIEIVCESDVQVEMSCNYIGKSVFWETNAHLIKFGLCRVYPK
jgi:hypothetical protein